MAAVVTFSWAIVNELFHGQNQKSPWYNITCFQCDTHTLISSVVKWVYTTGLTTNRVLNKQDRDRVIQRQSYSSLEAYNWWSIN